MTTLADPVPGGRPGDHDRATERAAELAGHGVTAVALSWVDTAGINRIKAVPLTALDRAAAWGVGMSPVFDTFLADDSIVATDVLGGPDGDLRLYPDLDGLVLLAGQPGWPGLRWTGSPRTARCTRPAPARRCGTRLGRRRRRRDGLGEHRDRVRARAAGRDGVRAGLPRPRVRVTRLVEQERVGADLLRALGRRASTSTSSTRVRGRASTRCRSARSDPVAAADPQRAGPADHPRGGPPSRLRVSFAPSVLAGGVGNGGHLHLSLWRDGCNLHAGGDGRLRMTAEPGVPGRDRRAAAGAGRAAHPEPVEPPADAAVALGRRVRGLGAREPGGRGPGDHRVGRAPGPGREPRGEVSTWPRIPTWPSPGCWPRGWTGCGAGCGRAAGRRHPAGLDPAELASAGSGGCRSRCRTRWPRSRSPACCRRRSATCWPTRWPRSAAASRLASST